MAFPATRMRRLRRTPTLRAITRETRLTPESLVYPLFVCPGEGVRKPIGSMPGVFNLSVDRLLEEARETQSLGIPGVILFGLPENKDEQASGAWAEDGIVQRATRAIKPEIPELIVLGDVCLCEYMSHGHCGVVKKNTSTTTGHSDASGAAAVRSRVEQYEIENDVTLEILARAAVSQAKAGVDVIAPSDMMDGRVAAIRAALDAAGFQNTPILC